MREIVLDTETTGMDPRTGDRLVEIGCIELINHVATPRQFWKYLNPQREVPEDAVRVHGLTTEFLADKPLFRDIAQAFLDFIGEAPLVIHNATFDMAFLNYELKELGYPEIPFDRAIDTLQIARRRYPGAPASLDALCKRFDIDNTGRTLHGALLDSELLAEVYLELKGGRQTGLGFDHTASQPDRQAQTGQDVSRALQSNRPARPARHFTASAEERSAHTTFIDQIPDAIWHRT